MVDISIIDRVEATSSCQTHYVAMQEFKDGKVVIFATNHPSNDPLGSNFTSCQKQVYTRMNASWGWFTIVVAS
jgi:hypothetical protein